MNTHRPASDPSLEPFGLPSGEGPDDIVTHLTDCVSAANRRLKEELVFLAETLDGAGQQCIQQTRECADSARQSVRARPLRALAGAFVIGLVVGRLTN